MKNTLLTLSLIACTILALLTKQGCNANKGMEAALAKSKLEDSIHIRTMDSLTDAANAIAVEMGYRDIEYARSYDSLTKIIEAGKGKLKFFDLRIKNLISTIHDYGSNEKDSSITNKADSLQRIYDDARSNVAFVIDQYGVKDSLCAKQISEKDSVIVELNGVISEQRKTFDAEHKVVIYLQNELIKAIKTGKKKALIRNIIDAILVAILIIKK